MENNNKKEKSTSFDKNEIMLTEEDIDSQDCYRHLLPEQKKELITLIYEISLVLYNSYFDDDGQP